MKPQSKNFNKKEAVEYICKKLGTKAYKVNHSGDFETKRLSTLKRIEKLIQSDIFVSKYSNKKETIKEVGHYFLNVWIRDDVLTIRHHKKVRK